MANVDFKANGIIVIDRRKKYPVPENGRLEVKDLRLLIDGKNYIIGDCNLWIKHPMVNEVPEVIGSVDYETGRGKVNCG